MVQRTCPNICGTNSGERVCDNEISCFTKIAGTLTGDEIIEHGLIIPERNSRKSNLQVTTYDLTLGEGHYIYDGYNTDKDKKWNLVFVGSDNRLRELNEQNSAAEQYNRLNKDKPRTLYIPPFGSAFVQLNETVDTYTVADEKNLLIVGRFDLKLSNVHQGLISQQATQVEPCYKGKLFCFIHNLSNQNISLKYGDKIATIEFSYVSCFCNKEKRIQLIRELKEKNKDKYKADFCSETGINEVRYFHAEEQLPDDCGLLGFNKKTLELIKSDKVLNELAKEVEKKVDKKAKWIPVIVAIIGAIVSVITAFLTLPGKSDVEQLKQQIEVLQKDITEINLYVEELEEQTK